MTKQPFLSDFPLVVFATGKRRLQAAIRRTSAIITRRSLSGYAVLFEDMLPGEFLASIDPTERQRGADPFAYFEWVFEKLMHSPAPEELEVLLPANWIKARPAASQIVGNRVA